VPAAPVNEEAGKQNGNLPGMGGVFNVVNLHLYHYAGNNPVKYVDPDGRTGSFPDNATDGVKWANKSGNQNTLLLSRILMGDKGFFSADIKGSGPCLFMAYLGVAQTYAKKNLTPDQIKDMLADSSLYDSKNDMAQSGNVVISTALEKLGVDTSKLDIKVEKSPDGKAAKNAFATIRGVGRQDTPGSTSGHYQEGTSTGGFKWEAIDGPKDINRKVGEIRNVYIIPKTQE
jgi:hypothetical protein